MKDDAYAYIKEEPFVTTQAGSRPLNKDEIRIARAYHLLDVVDESTQSVWTTVASGIAIIAGVIAGFAAWLSFIF